MKLEPKHPSILKREKHKNPTSPVQYFLKELQDLPPIDYNNTNALVSDIWLFLTNDKMPNKAMISKKAFFHEVGIMIDAVQSHAEAQ